MDTERTEFEDAVERWRARDMCHSTQVCKDRFEPGKPCAKKGCDQPAVMRGYFNCWGTVYEVDLCELHKDRSGKAGDSL